ncbi:HAD-IIIC family phosphatase [Photorhabdus sp. APURE]|uniref:HAD-IIIC family phosphatase n=1 Tax=Photorhabdus aballayi TaxID=2991723 RepID=UPI00223CE5A7|nr:HAD-IIIC family phosphatase [Photorhabdus aballayi]MCW7549947.1 HAD-IIIC family phosphatase [Photorhabdus aballayi]
MPNSILNKMISGKSIEQGSKQIINSLALCNLSHKALQPILNYEATNLNIHLRFMEADYSNYLSYVSLNQSIIKDFNPDIALIIHDESFYLDEYGTCKPIDDVKQNIDNIKLDVKRVIDIFYDLGIDKAKFFVSSLPYRAHNLNQYLSLDDRKTFQRLVYKFTEHIENSSSVFQIINLNEFNSNTTENIYKTHNTVASLEFLNYVATETIKLLKLISGKSLKCIITDLDNTLWDGIIAEDGLDNILTSQKASDFNIYQRWLLRMYEQGIILAIASKNDEIIVREVFEKANGKLKIDWDKFSFTSINWNRKSDNIKGICKYLNINPEHVLFIDDTKYECEEVKLNVPGITVFEFSDNIMENIKRILSFDYFIKSKLTDSDRIRNITFSQNKLREKIRIASKDNSDFLKSLNTTLTFTTYPESYIERISELTLRTNQFNMTTIRMNIKEVRDFLAVSSNKIVVFSCRDNLGDYGVIGCAFLSFFEKTCLIENIVMSCRIFERQVEFGIMNIIVHIAKKKNCELFTAKYTETNKNKKFKDFYKKCGFLNKTDYLYQVNLSEIKIYDKHTYVNIEGVLNEI